MAQNKVKYTPCVEHKTKAEYVAWQVKRFKDNGYNPIHLFGTWYLVRHKSRNYTKFSYYRPFKIGRGWHKMKNKEQFYTSLIALWVAIFMIIISCVCIACAIASLNYVGDSVESYTYAIVGTVFALISLCCYGVYKVKRISKP